MVATAVAEEAQVAVEVMLAVVPLL
jgi:hypothetical protein